MVSIALFQNGQLPVYMPETTIQSISGSNDRYVPLYFKVTRRIARFLFGHFNEGIPSFTTFAPSKLNATQCKNDSANFSSDGSTAFSREKSVYGLFVKHVRQVSGTWRLILFKYF